jgi:hypothetical protein
VPRAWTLALLAAAVLAGCGREDDAQLPASCRLGAPAVEAALREAPGEVRLENGTRLSDCLVRTSEQGDVLLVGEIYLGVASRLADVAAEDPAAPEAIRLGYLMGAVRRGAIETQGIHDELLRRLELETSRVDRASPAYRRGERAGRESG